MRNTQSRTVNTARNTTISLVCQLVALIPFFISRTVFIQKLGSEYLGVNGLFTSILTMLSFAELGLGNAIVFSMYKPLATGNTEKLKSLMRLYKKAYFYIGLTILGVGLLLIPFLPLIVKDAPDVTEDLTLIYALYLINTVVSYFVVYKKSIITADQRVYVVNIYKHVFNILQVCAQIAILYVGGPNKFIWYLLAHILFTFLGNFAVARRADRMYPFLKEPAKPLEKAESRAIFKDVRALAISKFGYVILNGTDSVLASAMFTVSDVGLISNYQLLIWLFRLFLDKVTGSVTASVGNLNALENREKQYAVFRKLFFVTSWLFGFASTGVLLMSSDVVTLWLGAEYTLPLWVVFGLCLNFYVEYVHTAANTFRVTLGMFKEGRLAPAAAAVLNLALSVYFGRRFGIAGIFISTSVARFVTTGLMDPILLFRRKFFKNPLAYYLKYIGLLGLYAALYLMIRHVVGMIAMEGILGAVVKCAVITVLFNGAMVLIFWRTCVFRELMQMGKQLILRRAKRVHANINGD